MHKRKLISDLISNLQFRSQLWIRCTVQMMQSAKNKKNEIFKQTTTDWIIQLEIVELVI